jgi:type I restriction enzyme M protein
LVIKKCREVNEDVLFIDASNHFEKKGKDNKLLPEHIENIVETYKNREIKDKYSYRATLQEIADNDYNLNIPRYVDTFEEEEPIDIDLVAEEIQALDLEITETDKRIATYCAELNIKTPF